MQLSVPADSARAVQLHEAAIERDHVVARNTLAFVLVICAQDVPADAAADVQL